MTDARRLRIWLGVLAGVTLLRLVCAAFLPVTPDEAYYRLWSQHLQAGYLDHPPGVAVWIRAGILLLGDTASGLRLTGPLAAVAGTLLTVLATRDFLAARGEAPEWRRPVIAGVLLNATLAIGLGAVMMTPDTPLLFCMSVFLWSLGRLVVTGDARWWLLTGAAAGAGFDSKYTMLLPAAGVGVWLLLTPEGRRWLRSGWLWAGVLLAVVLTGPVVWWNATHDWASFIRQGGRAGDWRPARAVQFLGELLGGQIGLLTPGVFVLAVMAGVRACRSRMASDRLLLCVAGVPLLVFAQHALGDRVQANWPVLIYPVLVVLVALFCARWWKWAAVPGVVLGALVLGQAVTGILPLNRHFDVTLRQGGGWPAFARDVRAAVPDAQFLASDDYGLVSELAFRVHDVPVLGAEPRWRWFDLPSWQCPAADGRGVFLRNVRRSFPEASPWARFVTPGPVIVRARGGREAEQYQLFFVKCPLAPAVLTDLRQVSAGR